MWWLFDVPKEAPTDFILKVSYSYIIPQFQNEISHLYLGLLKEATTDLNVTCVWLLLCIWLRLYANSTGLVGTKTKKNH